MSQILNAPIMRSKLTRILIFLFAGFFSQALMGQNNCDLEEMLKKNKSLLEDYQYIKTFPIEITKQVDKVRYSYVLNRETKYRLVTVDYGAKGERMVVVIRDPAKKVFANNKDKQKKGYLNQVDFVCPSTGVYFFEVTFENDHKDCGLNILGFKK
jgi:hypothetical protein